MFTAAHHPAQRAQRSGKFPAAALVYGLQRSFVGSAAALQFLQLLVQPGDLFAAELQLPLQILLFRFILQLDGVQRFQQCLAGLFVLETAERIVMITHGKLHPGGKRN